MNTELFTGKAEIYAQSRPGYPKDAIVYIQSLVTPNAVFADIGAGTGKFTEHIAQCGYEIYAIEPNEDMVKELAKTLKPYSNAKYITAPAEATTLPDKSIDAITVAQALHWFDPVEFVRECRRIGKPGAKLISIYNVMPGGSSPRHSVESAKTFFKNPTIKEFPNPFYYTREAWLKYMSSHSTDPLPTDPGYDEHMTMANQVFDNEQKDGLICRAVVTRIYSENLGE